VVRLFSRSFFAAFCPSFSVYSQKVVVTFNTTLEKHNLYTSKTMMMMRSCSARTPPTVVVENTKKVRYCFCRFKFSLCAFGVVVYVVVSRVCTIIAFLFGGDTFWIERERCWNHPATRVSVRRRRRWEGLLWTLLFCSSRERERERESAFERRRRRRARMHFD